MYINNRYVDFLMPGLWLVNFKKGGRGSSQLLSSDWLLLNCFLTTVLWLVNVEWVPDCYPLIGWCWMVSCLLSSDWLMLNGFLCGGAPLWLNRLVLLILYDQCCTRAFFLIRTLLYMCVCRQHWLTWIANRIRRTQGRP